MTDSPKGPVSRVVDEVVAGLEDAVNSQERAQTDGAIEDATEAIANLFRSSIPARGREPNEE
jgi:hypothetical protein